MTEFWIDMALSVIFALIKNPQKAAKYKAALRKLRDKLNTLPLGEE